MLYQIKVFNLIKLSCFILWVLVNIFINGLSEETDGMVIKLLESIHNPRKNIGRLNGLQRWAKSYRVRLTGKSTKPSAQAWKPLYGTTTDDLVNAIPIGEHSYWKFIKIQSSSQQEGYLTSVYSTACLGYFVQLHNTHLLAFYFCFWDSPGCPGARSPCRPSYPQIYRGSPATPPKCQD